jgi:hypothetical protein
VWSIEPPAFAHDRRSAQHPLNHPRIKPQRSWLETFQHYPQAWGVSLPLVMRNAEWVGGHRRSIRSDPYFTPLTTYLPRQPLLPTNQPTHPPTPTTNTPTPPPPTHTPTPTHTHPNNQHPDTHTHPSKTGGRRPPLRRELHARGPLLRGQNPAEQDLLRLRRAGPPAVSRHCHCHCH